MRHTPPDSCAATQRAKWGCQRDSIWSWYRFPSLVYLFSVYIYIFLRCLCVVSLSKGYLWVYEGFVDGFPGFANRGQGVSMLPAKFHNAAAVQVEMDLYFFKWRNYEDGIRFDVSLSNVVLTWFTAICLSPTAVRGTHV